MRNSVKRLFTAVAILLGGLLLLPLIGMPTELVSWARYAGGYAPQIEVSPSEFVVSMAPDTVTTEELVISNMGTSALTWLIKEEAGAAPTRPQAMQAWPQGADRSRPSASVSGAPAAPQAILPSTDAPLARGILSEGFDDVTTLPGEGWALINNSEPLGPRGWFQGNPDVFVAYTGEPNSYIGANYQSTGDLGTISNWLLTPVLTLEDGATFSFFTRTTEGSDYPDRIEVRLSLEGESTDVGSDAFSVGDFTTLLLEVNPNLEVGGYPESWTEFIVTLSGIGSSTPGRIAFRYFVTEGGTTGANSSYLGIDRVEYSSFGVGACELSEIAWLDADPVTGTTLPGESSTAQVTFDTTGLSAGVYTGNLCISSNDPDTANLRVPVTLFVEAATAVSHSTLSAHAAEGARWVTLGALVALGAAGMIVIRRRRR